MESSGPISDLRRSNASFRRYGMQLTSANFLPRPLSALLEFTGLMHGRAHSSVSEQGVAMSTSSVGQNSDSERAGDGGAEVSIRIFGVGEPDQDRVENSSAVVSARNSTDASTSQSLSTLLPMRISSNDSSPNNATLPHSSNAEERGEAPDTEAAGNGREAASQRYDFQQLARWIEQALPFTILLLMVFIRQHLQGFFVAFWITAVMFWANDVLRKQTALKNERKPAVLVALGCVLVVHIIGVYWWYSRDALWRPLILIPPRDIPPFWDAIFIIVINGRRSCHFNLCFMIMLAPTMVSCLGVSSYWRAIFCVWIVGGPLHVSHTAQVHGSVDIAQCSLMWGLSMLDGYWTQSDDWQLVRLRILIVLDEVDCRLLIIQKPV